MVLIDGKYLPKDLQTSWKPAMEAAKAQLAGLEPAMTSGKEEFMRQLALFEANLDKAEAAPDLQSAFAALQIPLPPAPTAE